MAPTLLRKIKWQAPCCDFNFLDVLNLYGERFIQLHPLLHEYAREKLTHSNSYPQIYEHYLDVIPEWTQVFPPAQTLEQSFPLAWPVQDKLAALEELIARGEWLKAIRLLKQSFEILAAEGHTRRLEHLIWVSETKQREETSASRLLKVALANLKGGLALSVQNVLQAQEQFELALRTGQGSSLPPGMEQVYLDEIGRAIIGIARCLVYKKEYRAGLDLLEDLYSRDIFLSLPDQALKAERELLLGDIHVEMCDFREAVECFETVLAMPQGKADRQKTNQVLERQANCYRNLGEMKQAIDIYSSLFAEQNQPADLRAGVGLGLAASLTEAGQYAETRRVLDEVEIILGDYAGLDGFSEQFARLWKCRAIAALALGENKAAMECARKSLEYWINVPDSDVEKRRMQDLIDRIEG